MLLQEQEKHTRPTENGQHFSGDGHQQDGRDDVPSAKQYKQGVFALMHGERHLCASSTSCRETECNSGQGVQSNEGQIRLDALPESLPGDQVPTGSTGNRPRCFEAINSTASLCELEARPRSDDHRCLYNILVRAEGIRQLTIESSGQGPSPSSTAGSRSDSGGPSVEISTLVPSTARHVHVPSQVASNIRQLN